MRKDYCLVLGFEKNRHRSLVATARATGMPIAVMEPRGMINGNYYADLVIEGNPDIAEQSLDALIDFEKKTGLKPLAVVPLTEMSLSCGSLIAKHYSLPYLSDQTLEIARDKFKMRQAFEKHGLIVPKYARFSTKDELLAVTDSFEFPVVVKPSNAGGSEGVSLAQTKDDLTTAFNIVAKAMSGYLEKFGAEENLYQVEEFIPAIDELSVEILNTSQGRYVLAITDRDMTDIPYFVETAFYMPSKYANRDDIKETALKACESLGMHRGLAHVELRIRPDNKAVLIEVNARTPGGKIPELLEYVSGVNMFELHAQCFLEEHTINIPEINIKGQAAITMMKKSDDMIEGKVISLSYFSSNELSNAVMDIKTWVNIGDKVETYCDFTKSLGLIEFYWNDDTLPVYKHRALTEHITSDIIEIEKIK